MLGRLTLIGGAAIVGGIAALVTGLGDANDALAKSSRRAGVTAQTYAELRHAFGLAGVDQGQFDKAMVKMTRNLGDAKAGLGGLTTFLKKTSPALLEQLKNTTNNEEALNLLILSMGSLEDPSKRAAFAAAAFGRAGQEMTLILEGGVKGLQNARKEFRDLHGVIDGKALKSSEDFVDAQARLKLSIEGTKQAIGSQLLPILTPLLENLAKWVAANREMIATKVSDFIVGFGQAIASVDWPGVAKFAGELADAIGELWTFIGGAEGAMTLWIAVMATSFISTITKAGGAVVDLGIGVVGLAKNMKGSGGVLKNIVSVAFSFAKVFGGIALAALVTFKGGLIAMGKAALANPVLLIIAGVAAGAALIIDNWEPISAFFSNLWDGITRAFTAAMAFISRTLDSVRRSIEEVAESLDVFGILDDDLSPEQAAGNKEFKRIVAERAKAKSAREEAAATSRAAGGTPTSAVVAAGAGEVGLKGEILVKVQTAAGVSAVVEGKTDTPAVPIKASVGRSAVATGGV